MSVRLSSAGLRENTSRNTHAVAASLILGDASLKRVLDIPAGEGAFTRRLLDAELSVCAGDCEPIHKVAEADFQVCDMNEPLPFEEASFDAVACLDGIEHLEHQAGFVRECHRILRHAGALVITTPNLSSLRSRWRFLWTGFHNKGKSPLNEAAPTPLHHISLIGLPELRYLLHTHGFELTDITTNRIKSISWLYAPLIPFAWLTTRRVFRREEKDPGQRDRNRDILRQLFTRSVLFGETLIVMARKRA